MSEESKQPKKGKPWKYDLYFPHKAGARNDPKLVKVFLKFKYTGLGVYWSLMEILREQPEHKYPSEDLDALAHSMALELPDLEAMISLFVKVDLLKKDGGFLFSAGLLDNMNRMKEKSEKARDSVRVRWNKRNTDVSQSNNGGNTTVIQVKNSKVNPSKEGLSLLDNSPVSKADPAPEALLRGLVSGWPGEVDKPELIRIIHTLEEGAREAMCRDLEHPEFGEKGIAEMGIEKWVKSFDL
jgi:hypothetical protein